MCELIPIPNEFRQHPIYDKYESNRLGVVRHVKHKKDVGTINNGGYLKITVKDHNGIIKRYYKHRFIYECFYGKINNAKLVIDHINNIKTDNRLENLQLITQSQNVKKAQLKDRNRSTIKVRAINTNSGESSDSDSVNQCSRDLDIIDSSIRFVLNGRQKTATSKKDKDKYRFEKID